VRRNGVPVGYIRAASYGHTLGGAVGLTMIEAPADAPKGIDPAWIESGTWEVDIAGTLYPAIASLKPLYDPENKKIKG
jgi:4-methylaminobutanoate oxidase (formaldehyde-forming)